MPHRFCLAHNRGLCTFDETFLLLYNSGINQKLNLDSDEEDALYRVVQEGLTNAVRHGRADRISVRVTRTGDLVTVSIRDNGTGCAKLEEGFGLRHMRERLNMLGGTLSYGNLDSDAQDGYTGFFITVGLPIRNKKGE